MNPSDRELDAIDPPIELDVGLLIRPCLCQYQLN